MRKSQAWGARMFQVTCQNGKQFKLTVKGRERWALTQLMESGKHGCKPLLKPAPRWSAYVHLLRGMVSRLIP